MAPDSRAIDAERAKIIGSPNWVGSRWTTWLAAAAIVLAALVVYANSFTGKFLLDDDLWIVNNPSIRTLSHLDEVLFPSNPTFASGRPVVNLTLAINYALTGTDVRGYHAVNLIIHILAALTLFGIARRTLAMPVLRNRFTAAASPLALAIALVWVVHPLQTAAVSYIIQRTEALVGLFYLLTLYCVIRAASRRSEVEARAGCRKAPDRSAPSSPQSLLWYLAAAGACLLGMGTKEVMATAPLVILLYDRTFLSGSLVNALRKRWGLYAAMAASWGVIGWCLTSTGFHSGSTGFSGTGFTAVSYAATEPGVIVHYLQLAFWPVGMCLDYGWPAADSIGKILPATLLIAALAAMTIWTLFKNPPLGFLGAWFFAILAPTSSFVPIKDAAFDHRMYLPLAAIAALVVVGGYLTCEGLVQKSPQRGRARFVLGRLTPIFLLAATVVGLGWSTIRRNELFSSAEDMWQDVVAKSPENARAHNNLAVQLLANGKIDEALVQCQLALKYQARYADAESNLGLALAKQHKFEEAVVHYRRALEIQPKHLYALDLLADVLFETGKTDGAMDMYQRALAIDPDNAKTHFDYANCLRQKGQSDDAIHHYELAIEIDPEFAEAHNNLAAVLARQNNFSAAIKHFELAIKFKPDHADAHYNLGMIFYSQGRIADAESHWRDAVRLQPKQVEYLRNLALVLATNSDASARNGAEAVELAERAVGLTDHRQPDTLAILAAAFAEAGQYPHAVTTAERALELAQAPGDHNLAEQLTERLKLYRAGKPYHDQKK